MAGVRGRDPAAAAREPWDLVVVGGGVQGVMLLLEASRRGLRTLLLEREDFGGGTSWNSLRILHGGLRYLQRADLVRFRRSVEARRWFFRAFPELVRPLPCLMPLYGRGMRRPPVLRVALGLNDLLSFDRNAGVDPSVRLPSGRVLGARETLARCPVVTAEGLQGAALWFDGLMVDPPRILMEAMRWVRAEGGVALNYVEATGIESGDGGVRAVVARDRVDGTEHAFETGRVAFCVGPDASALRRILGRTPPSLPPAAVAFNVLFRKRLPSDGAVAVEPEPATGGNLLFAYPLGPLTLAGTVHLEGRSGDGAGRVPARADVEGFVETLRRALPGWEPEPGDAVRVLHGELPAVTAGRADLARRPRILDLATEGGHRGAWAVVAVKFTTSPAVGARVLHRMGFPGGRRVTPPSSRPPGLEVPSVGDFLDLVTTDAGAAEALVRRLAAEGSALRAEDVVLRRTDWGLDPARAHDAVEAVGRYLGPAPSLDG